MKLSKRSLKRAAAIIESAENRCLACDGPTGSTLKELTDREMRELCRLLKKDVITEHVLRTTWKKANK